MDNNTIKNIFDFLEEKGEHKAPFLWKWKNNIPLTEEDLNVESDLNFYKLEIKSLPKGLQVDNDLSITNSPLAKLSDEAILSMIEPGGYINGDIIREDNG
jgi:hypothetical protein